MGDQNEKAAGSQVAEQQPKPPQGGETKAQPEKFLTLEQAQRMAKDAEEAAFRRAQGLIEKTNAGVLKKVQGDLKAIEKTIALQRKVGVNITPEQESTMKQQVLQQAFTEEEVQPPSQPTEQQPAPAVAPKEEEIDLITSLAFDAMEEAGVEILEEDLEYKKFVLPTVNSPKPRDFLKAVDQAIEAKKQRLSSESVGKIPGAAGPGETTSPLPKGLSPIQLFKMGYEKSK